ncbi:MAG: hypothetical protein AUH20_06290 [Candidatus Rokubacteria bacterium 13_2_20CM_69_15_2]|nr:MAG: hypothetical protein AUH20_06290 [Candidatus Rokubacteria bacterium 13_2_20CM_69_15_2]
MKNETPSWTSIDSCVLSVSSARAKSGPVIGAPGARCIFVILARTSGARPALRSTSPAVARSVNASTPLRR